MFIRNLHIIQDSRERLWGQVEYWQGLWCWILMKLSQKLLNDDPYHMTHPPRLQGETWRTGGVLTYDTTSRFNRNLYILQDSRERHGGLVESWQGFWCWILKKLSQKLLKYDPYHMTPPPGSSGTSTSSKTPGRDLEDRWSLDRVSDVGSWWNFHRSFWSMIPIIWHHLQVHQESPHPLRLQEETWRTGGVLTGFLMLDLDETFTKASEVWSLS